MSKPSVNFDNVAARYDDTRGGERRGMQFATDLAGFLDRDKSALEVGVGTGVVALALQQLGLHIFGMDLAEEMLAYAKPRLRTRPIRADAQHQPFATHSFDQAYSVWVLHVVGDVPAVLSEVARVLRPGGRYFVMDGHYIANSHETDEVAKAWFDISCGLGIPPRRNRAKEWAQLSTTNGFRVVDLIRHGPYEFEQSYAEVAHNIESRANASMWHVADDDWKRVVVPVIERLRSLPNAEEPVVHKDFQDILVLESDQSGR